MRVLDIGTFDGLCAFEAERRGASEVVAIDLWDGNGTDDPTWWSRLHTGGSGFNTAKTILQSNVRFVEMSVYELTSAQMGLYDVVIMSGLLYHLKDPVTALQRALSVTREVLIVESLVTSFSDYERPFLLFAKYDENMVGRNIWWKFSIQALEQLCKWAGARRTTVPYVKWYPSVNRAIVVSPRTPIYDSPRGDARRIWCVEHETKLQVVSRHSTYRDGLNWVRVVLPGERSIDATGWVVLDYPNSFIEAYGLPTRELEGRAVVKAFH